MSRMPGVKHAWILLPATLLAFALGGFLASADRRCQHGPYAPGPRVNMNACCPDGVNDEIWDLAKLPAHNGQFSDTEGFACNPGLVEHAICNKPWGGQCVICSEADLCG